MELKDIHSVELDRSKPFDMRINLKDKTGYVLESVSVKQNVANETLAVVTKKWLEAVRKV